MKKITFHIFLLLLIVGTKPLFCQDIDYSREQTKPKKTINDKKDKPDNDIRDKFVFGGGVGLQVGSQTYIELSPKLGYRLSEKALIGGGVNYIYYSDYDGNQSIYGGNLFASYEPIENIFAWTEYEMLNFGYYNTNSEFNRKWVNSPFIGIGYRQPMGERGFIQLIFLYNLNFNSDSPYTSPWVPRISFFL
jgi:hypothetical protein